MSDELYIFIYNNFLYIIFSLIIIYSFLFKYFINKKWYNINFLGSFLQIWIIKIIWSIIWLFIWWIIIIFLWYFLIKIWISSDIFKSIILKIILVILQIWIYFFFYYKFLNSDLSYIITDKKIRKDILIKFFIIFEIFSAFFQIYYLNIYISKLT